MCLYNVSEPIKTKKNQSIQTKVVQEPRDQDFVKFYMNQSYLRTQEKKETQLWRLNPSIINSRGRFFTSVIYEQYGSDQLTLSFLTSVTRRKGSSFELDYPQQPVPQTWMIDYPLLAYKTFTPKNREIAIVHMALNMPQRIIHLGQWEFVSFVNHT